MYEYSELTRLWMISPVNVKLCLSYIDHSEDSLIQVLVSGFALKWISCWRRDGLVILVPFFDNRKYRCALWAVSSGLPFESDKRIPCFANNFFFEPLRPVMVWVS